MNSRVDVVGKLPNLIQPNNVIIGPSISAFPGQHNAHSRVSSRVLKTVAPRPTSLHPPAPRPLHNIHIPLLQRQQANNRHFLLRPATTRPLLPFCTPSNALIHILTCVCSFLFEKDTADTREQHSYWVAAGPDVCYRYPRATSREEEGGRVERFQRKSDVLTRSA